MENLNFMEFPKNLEVWMFKNKLVPTSKYWFWVWFFSGKCALIYFLHCWNPWSIDFRRWFRRFLERVSKITQDVETSSFPEGRRRGRNWGECFAPLVRMHFLCAVRGKTWKNNWFSLEFPWEIWISWNFPKISKFQCSKINWSRHQNIDSECDFLVENVDWYIFFIVEIHGQLIFEDSSVDFLKECQKSLRMLKRRVFPKGTVEREIEESASHHW